MQNQWGADLEKLFVYSSDADLKKDSHEEKFVVKLRQKQKQLENSLDQLAKKNRYETIIRNVTQCVHSSLDIQEVFENAVESIKIGAYDGSDLERDWQDWVSRNLNPDEQAQLEKERAANRIFGNRLGGFDRTIEIEETGGMVNLTESARQGDSQVYQTHMQGPALARDLIVEPFQHLLE